MTPVNKILTALGVWAAITAGMLFFVLPKLGGVITHTQETKATQYAELEKLRQQTRVLQKMQEDLNNIKRQPVQPEDFFTRDVKLVHEIQHEEEIAAQTGNKIKLTISGTADKAQNIQSASALFQVPYTITLQGRFDGLIKFLDLLENSYFISPVSGLNIRTNTDESDPNANIVTTIYANFFIHK
jgi:hypothetical protein